jgi:DNA ligase-1
MDPEGVELIAPFSGFAELCEALAATSSRLRRAALVAEYLRHLDPNEAEVAARWLVGRAFPEAQGRRLALSGRAVWAALERIGAPAAVAEWSGAEDFGELVRRALSGRRPEEPHLAFGDLIHAFAAIASATGSGSRHQRVQALAELLRRASPVEAKYAAKIVIGEMRHGVQEGVLLEALASLAGAEGGEVRRAQQALGDVGRVARIARAQGRPGLLAVGVQLFRPLKPMLAQTAADVAEAFDVMAGRLALEWKLDGARVQVHRRGDEVRLFSRRLQDITASLPEVADAVRLESRPHDAILEGEVIAVDGERPLPFQELMRRFRRRRDVAGASTGVAVRLYLFDLLLHDNGPLLDAPAAERWSALRRACGALPCVGRIVPQSVTEAQAFYDRAVAAGFEGVMAKTLDGPYTPGVRGKGWLKIKKVDTLDLVVTAADWGYGRRHGWLSNYHLAARDPRGGGFAPIGKTFKGLTDDEFRAMTRRLLALKVGESGGTVYVRPEVVVEVGFGGVQKSPRYPCGMALRFARILRIRDDKPASEADTVESLRALFEHSHRAPRTD